MPDGGQRGLLRSSALISVGVLVSRLTGLLRTWALIAVLGTTSLASAYNFANNVPNILYELVAGGVLSAVLLPIFVDQISRRDRRATSAVVSVSVVGLAGLTVVGVVAAPLLGWGIAAVRGGANQVEQQEALTVLLRWFVPQIFFYGLMTIVTSLLHARRRFGAAAFAPALNNLVTIAAFVFAVRATDVDMHDSAVPFASVLDERWALTVLGLGTTLGVVVNALVLLPPLRRERLGIRFRPSWRHPAIAQAASASKGALGYVAVSQIAVIVTSLLANRYSPEGGFAAYTYANLFFYFAFGLLAVSVTTALAPELATAAQAGNMALVRREWVRGLRLIMLLMAPAATGLVVLARPLMGSIPRLSEAGADLTASILAWFSVGLAAFSLFQYVVRCFYALSDTRTPFRLALVQQGIIVGLGLVLAPIFGIQGLAAAYAVGFIVSAVVAFAAFAKRVGRLPVRAVKPVGAMLLAAVAMATVAAAAVAILRWDGRMVAAPLQAAVGVTVAVVVYPAYLWALRADSDLRAAMAMLRRLAGRH